MQQKRIVDVLEFSDPGGTTIIHKEPSSGADIQYGAQLVVRETQQAVFFKDGRLMGTFGPGRHTLTTNNLPWLKDIIANFTSGGKTPFQAEVFFVNTKVFKDMKWGTTSPIDMQDPQFGIIPLRAYGRFTMKIVEPQLFITTIGADYTSMTTRDLEEYMRDVILTRFNDLIGEQFQSYFKIRKEMNEFSAAMKFSVKDDFGKYGIEISDFLISQVTVPEKIQEAFTQRASMEAMGDMGKYMQFKTANAIGDMANRPAGSGTDPMGAGMGMGMGMMMPQMMAQAMQGSMGGNQMGQTQGQQMTQAPPQAAAMVQCPQCQAGVPAGTKFCSNCGFNMTPPKALCPACNAEVAPNAKFCSSCGGKIGEEQKIACTGCGAEMTPGSRFCPECGNKMA